MDEDITTYAVNYAMEKGADYAEARIQRDEGFSALYREGRLEAYLTVVREGIGIRVLMKGALAFASTGDLKKERIREVVESAIRKASALSERLKEGTSLAEEPVSKAKWRAEFKEDPLNIPVEERVEVFKGIEERLRDYVKYLPSRVYELSASKTSKLIVNSEGSVIYCERPNVYFSYSLLAYTPGRGSVHRWSELGSSKGWEAVRGWNLPEKLVEEAKVMMKILEEAKSPPLGEEVDVILGSEVVGLMVHESCGHPSEADRILGREAAQAGESFMKPDMKGKRIGSKYVTISDDPTIPGSSGFYLYDDEGVKARKRILFKEGVINEFLHNRETAAVFKVRSNAAARASSFDREPIIRMANTYFEPGDYNFEELIEDIRKGVYIKTFMEWNIDDKRWNQRYVGLEAYLIERGELKGLVRNPALEITTGGLYESIDGVGRELKFYAGICGKGDPMQGVPVWFGGPEVRVRKIRLSAST